MCLVQGRRYDVHLSWSFEKCGWRGRRRNAVVFELDPCRSNGHVIKGGSENATQERSRQAVLWKQVAIAGDHHQTQKENALTFATRRRDSVRPRTCQVLSCQVQLRHAARERPGKAGLFKAPPNNDPVMTSSRCYCIRGLVRRLTPCSFSSCDKPLGFHASRISAWNMPRHGQWDFLKSQAEVLVLRCCRKGLGKRWFECATSYLISAWQTSTVFPNRSPRKALDESASTMGNHFA